MKTSRMTHGHWYSTVKKALKTSSSTPPRCTGLLSVDPPTELLPRVGIDSKMVPAVAILLFGTLKRVFPTLERPVWTWCECILNCNYKEAKIEDYLESNSF